MGSVDLSVFSAADFNSKAWINTLCSQKPDNEVLDRFLAEMEMRLQLAAEEIETGLQESSSQAMRRIPFAVQEIYRLQGDIQGMQDQVRVLAGRIATDASESATCVEHLRQVDGVKRNMESAHATLKEATELSGMFTKVEDVFASGELPRVADMLRSMRASLALVGDVPEFREGRVKLRQLEDRLQAQVEGALAAALNTLPSGADSSSLAAGGGGVVDEGAEAHTRSLCSLLLAVDRYSTIESLYVDARLSRVHNIWEEMSGTTPQQAGAPPAAGSSIGQWLPVFYAQLVPLLRTEVGWVGRVLPEQRGTIIPALFTAIFKKIGRGVTQRLSDRSVPLATLMALASDMSGVASSVADLLPADLPAATRADLLARLLEPLEDAVKRYPSLEAAGLDAEVQAVLPPPPPPPTGTQPQDKSAAVDGDALVRQLWDAVRHVASACCAAIDRCMALTGGSELADMAHVCDKVVVGLITRLTAHTSHAVAKAGHSAALQQQHSQGAQSMEEVSEEVGTALRLVVLAGEVAGGALLRKVDAALRAALNTALPRMEAAAAAYAANPAGPSQAAGGGGGVPSSPLHPSNHAAGGGGAGARGLGASFTHQHHHTAGVDPLSLRLGRHPQRLQKVQALARSLADPRSTPLPQATHQADGLVRSTQAAAMSTLLSRVKTALAPLATLPQWRKRSGGGAIGGMLGLPSFSVEPLPYVTQLGDYLMYLPQQLEVLFSDELMASSMTQDEQDELAAHWLDRVVAGAAAAYADAVAHLSELSPQGGVQLAADVEYFCNVMSALHVAPPPSLLTVQLFAGMPDAEFPAAAKAALAEGGADAAALRTLATQRQLQSQLA